MSYNQETKDIGHDNPSLDLNGEISNGHMSKHQLQQEHQQHEQQILKEGNSDSQVVLILSGDDLFEDLPAPGRKSYKLTLNFTLHHRYKEVLICCYTAEGDYLFDFREEM